MDVLLVDTDIRALEEDPEISMLIGEGIVNGEGTGGNLNLARACFRKDMEELGKRILGRPLVLMVADCQGATSIAGCVEMNSLLTKVGLPSLVIMIASDGSRKPSLKTRHMMDLLIDGPLRPGIKVQLNDDENPHLSLTEEGLIRSIFLISRASSRDADIQLPGVVWNLMRKNGGPFSLQHRSIERGKQDDRQLNASPPSVIVLNVDPGTTAEEIKNFTNTSFGTGEDLHLGLLGSSETNMWEISVISRYESGFTQNEPGRSNLQTMTFDEMMSFVDSQGFSPERTF